MKLKFQDYQVLCRHPETGQEALFKVAAVSPAHADTQARDGWFGLLAPPSQEERDALEVHVAKA